MINTIPQYITVTPNVVKSRGWFHVILNYYDENHKRKQPWRKLGIQAKPRK